jgi:pyridoxine 5-phosphate synthase
MTLLSVNVNKIAVLRNSRGDQEPNVGLAVRTCIAAGCGGITVHPRPDLRHIRPDDVYAVANELDGVELNIEGNPFAPTHDEYPGLAAIVRAVRPTQCTLVPDANDQLTSDHGFDLRRDAATLKPVVAELKSYGCRVSLFIDAAALDIEQAAQIGADRIEIYTGPYAKAYAHGSYEHELNDCQRIAHAARAVGLGVNAGHDLNQTNLGALKRAIPFLNEVSIGHALISDALYAGLTATVRAYLAILADTRTR